jgi:formylglycine-generating enzyme required for sulfatase activity
MRGRFLLPFLLASSGPVLAQVNFPIMADIPAGRFIMGAPDDADAQQGKPQHEVRIAAFRLAKTLVTFAQYDRFAKATRRALPVDDGLGRGQMPVINIRRADAFAYIAWLNRQSGQRGFRLVSEAEWEYAARAGTTTAFYWGNEPDQRFANTRGLGAADRWDLTSPVGSFPPNPWGLSDMAGNVWEMTADCLYPDYIGAPTDGSPRTRPGCDQHVVRGGDYSSSRRGQRPTARAAAGDSFRSTSLGFRVAQDVAKR